MLSHSYLSNADVDATEHLYQQYKNDKSSVDESWQRFFEGFDFARINFEDGGEIPENFQKEVRK